jgi:serine protease AprX
MGYSVHGISPKNQRLFMERGHLSRMSLIYCLPARNPNGLFAENELRTELLRASVLDSGSYYTAQSGISDLICWSTLAIIKKVSKRGLFMSSNMRYLFLKLPILVLVSGVSFAQVAKVAQDVDLRDPEAQMDVIVQYKQPPTPAVHQHLIDGGGTLRAALKSVKAGLYTIHARQLAALAADPNVKHISPDRKLRGLLDNSAAAVNAPVAWNAGLSGNGIGIAVIDSGISPHADLVSGGNRLVFLQSLVGGGNSDYYGHGEHVAGIIAGNGTDSSCTNCTRHLVGIAPKANLLSLRILDQNGEGTDSAVIAAIDLAIELKSWFQIRVINLSLGRPVYESYTVDPLCQAVEAAWKAGIVVVVAAGNDGRDNSFGNSGYGTINAPGNDPYVITVGAMKSMGTPQRTDDLIASYSSKGPTQIDHIIKPDLVAPGNLVVSLLAPTGTLETAYPQNAVPLNYYESTPDTTPSPYYFRLSGTSMAAPVVSGAVALLLEAHPELTPDQVKARLMRTAYKQFPQSSTAFDSTTNQSFTSYYDLFTVGAGYLDIAAALADTTVFTGSALSPVATSDSSSGTVVCSSNTVCADPILWAAQTVWGNQSVWGNTTLDAVELTSIAIYGEP